MAHNKGYNIWAIILAVIALLLVFASLFLPWWGVHKVSESTFDDGDSMKIQSSKTITPYKQGYLSLYTIDNDHFTVFFDIITILIFMVLLGLSLFTIMGLLFMSGTIQGIKVQFIVLSIALLLTISIPIIFMIACPYMFTWNEETDAERDGRGYTRTSGTHFTNDFWGKNVTSVKEYDCITNDTITWGPDIGWFLPIASALCLVICPILVILGRRKEDASQAGPEMKKADADAKNDIKEDQKPVSQPQNAPEPDLEDENSDSPIPEDERNERELYEQLKKKYDSTGKLKHRPDSDDEYHDIDEV